MPAFEFDVDASIAAGWEHFASRLADLVRDLVPGAIFDLAVPVLGSPSAHTPFIRFTALAHGYVEAEVSGGGSDEAPTPLNATQLAQLDALGWREVGPASPDAPGAPPGPRVTLPSDRSIELAHLVAGTLEQVFGIRHPVFLHDVTDEADDVDGPPGSDALASDHPGTDHPGPENPGPDHPEGPGTHAGAASVHTGPDPEHPASAATAGPGAAPLHTGTWTLREDDFLPQQITDPDQATRAVGAALSDVYRRRIRPDEHDVFTVPAGCVLLFVRAHRSLPLVVFRSPLVQAVEDVAAAETEVAILNRDSLWCRYVFDGTSIIAESEFVDRVFVPVNFKIQLAEISAELDDVYPDLARRVAGRHRPDLRASDEPDGTGT